ncbi:MAG: hypothetical protein ACRDQA_15175 [Nocardioidaceae bacterium]
MPQLGMRLRFTQAARSRHRIAPSRARHVMATTIGHPITTRRGRPGVLWVGADQDGNVLDVIAALDEDQLIVTHVMPHRWKERS